MDFKDFNRKTNDELRSTNPFLKALVNDLESLNHEIHELVRIIWNAVESDLCCIQRS